MVINLNDFSNEILVIKISHKFQSKENIRRFKSYYFISILYFLINMLKLLAYVNKLANSCIIYIYLKLYSEQF